MAASTWVVRPLVLPVGASTYEVAPVGYTAGLELQDVMNGKHKTITKKSPDADVFRLCMGETWDQMEKDGQPYPVMLRAGVASIQFQSALVSGVDMDAALAIGEQAWDANIDPEAMAAAITAATQQAAATSTTSTSTASAGKTPRRASTKPTTSPRRTPPTKSSPKPAKASPVKSSGRPSGTSSA